MVPREPKNSNEFAGLQGASQIGTMQSRASARRRATAFPIIACLIMATVAIAKPAMANEGTKAGQQPTAQNNFQLFLAREKTLLLRGALPDAAPVKAWVSSLNAQGRWPDIDYTNQEKAFWKTSDHLVRVKALSRALVDPKSPLYKNAELKAATFRALDDWITNRYKNPNWWHNDIGVPIIMHDILVLIGDQLQGERRAGALAILNQYGRAKPNDGANTVWEAQLGLVYGAFTEDSALVAQQSKLISGEVKVSRGEGIQSDGSYHQHGPRLQQFHYGGAFQGDIARLGWLLHGTPWAISPDKMQILGDCVLNGSQWMVRGISTVPGTLDRSVSRPNALRGDLRTVAGFLREAIPARAKEFDALIARQSGTGKPLVGFRSYPRSDFSVYQRPEFSFFVKTVSDRTQMTEIGMNGDNLKGQKLNAGDHYLLREGEEYFNLPPVWDWDLLPGVTWAKGAGGIQRQPFVGAIGDGVSGATVMDYRFGNKEGTVGLSARKLWATDGDTLVCLISDLKTMGTTEPVRTALDQCLLQGTVTVADKNGGVTIVPPGIQAAQPLRWIHHSGFVYIPLGTSPVSLKTGPVTGAWQLINQSTSKDPVTKSVFLPVLEQGTSPNGTAGGFAISLARTSGDAAKIADKPSWQILKNDAGCQAVRFADGNLMVAFYQAGKLEEAGKAVLEVSQPCLVLRSKDGLRLCDPTQKGGIVEVTWAGKRVNVTLPAEGLASAVVAQ
jgi:chondroitin AC lyase